MQHSSDQNINGEITVNEETGRFEWDIDGQTAFLLFRPMDEHTWAYTYVFVPPASRGQGYASQLTRYALEYADSKGMKVHPVCPYIRAFSEKNKAEFEQVLKL